MEKRFLKYCFIVTVLTYTMLFLNHFISLRKVNNISVNYNNITANAENKGPESERYHDKLASGTYFSPSINIDGTKILFSSSDNIFEMDISGENIRQLTTMGHCYNPVYNKECSSILFARNDGIYTLDIKTKEVKKVIESKEKERSFSNPNYTPEGDIVYFTGKVILSEDGGSLIQKEAGICIFKKDTGKSKKILDGYNPVLSKDGKKIAYELDGNVYIFDMNSRENKFIDKGKYVSWSMSGDFISYSKHQKESLPYTKIKGAKNLFIDRDYSNIWIADVSNGGKKKKVTTEQFNININSLENWAKEVKGSGAEQHFILGAKYAYLDSVWTQNDKELLVTVYSPSSSFGLMKIEL